MLDKIKLYLTSPVFKDDADKTRVSRALYPMLLILSLVFFINGLSIVIINPQLVNATINFVAFLSLVGLQVLVRRGHVRLGGAIFVAYFWILISVFTYFFIGISLVVPLSYLILVLMAGLFVGRPAAAITAALAILALGTFFALRLANLLPEPRLTTQPAVEAVSIVALLLTATFVLNRTLSHLERTRTELSLSNQKLAESQNLLVERIADRTRDVQLAAEVSYSVSHLRDMDRLLSEAVNLIGDRFQLYYTQIYLTDTSGRNLLLAAGTGEVGARLIESGHRLPVGPGSINGRAASDQHSVIVADTTTSPFFRPNPLLPQTRSEMAVPLIASNRVVGVLDMQSARAGALSTDSLPAFEALAGQLAIAIENARLFSAIGQSQTVLEEDARKRAFDSWQEYLNAIERGERIGYHVEQESGTTKDEPQVKPAEEQLLDVPIIVAGQQVGAIQLVNQAAERWTAEDGQLVSAVADQVAQQIENLRILAEAEHYRAEAEEASRRLTREGWAGYRQAQNQDSPGYSYDNERIQPLSHGPVEAASNGRTLAQELTVRGVTIGHLVVSDPDLSEEAQILLAAVASRLSGHIENLRLSEQTQQALAETERRAEEQGVINKMAQAVSRQLDQEQLLATVYEQIRRVLPVDAFTVALHDPDTDLIHFPMVYDSGQRYEQEPTPMTPHGSTSTVIRDGQPKLMLRTGDEIAQLQKEGGLAFVGDTQKISASLLYVPLSIRERTFGVLSIQSYQFNAYNEGDVELLSGVANHVAVALENARLFEQTQEALSETAVLYQASAQLSVARTYEDVLTVLREHTALGRDVTNASIMLFDSAWSEAQPRWADVLAFWNPPELPRPDKLKLRFPLQDYPSTATFMNPDEPAIVEDTISSPVLDDRLRALFVEGFQARSVIFSPLVVGGAWIGYASAMYPNTMALTEADLLRIKAVGQQAAVAIQGLRNLELAEQRAAEAQLRSEELDILNEMGRALTSLVDVDATVESIYQHTARLMEAKNLYVALYDSETDTVDIRIFSEEEQVDRTALRRRAGKGVTEYVINSRQPLLIPDNVMQKMAELNIEVIGRPAMSWLGVPMIIGQQVVGIIAVQSFTTPGVYGEHDQELLTAVASQAAIAIENARLFGQVQARARRERILREVTARVRGASDVDSVMRTAVQEVGRALGRQAFVYLGDDRTEQPSEMAEES